MSDPQLKRNRSLLVIDDQEGIHRDFRKILCAPAPVVIDEIEAVFLGDGAAGAVPATSFEIDSAFQGEEGFKMVTRARAEGRRYAVAFVDMRMPPGWDGVHTIEKLWDSDPDLQVVICTAYSDYSWREIVDRLGETDQLLILKKPFDEIEVRQLALALTEKSHAARQARLKMDDLNRLASERTTALKKEIVERQRAEKILREREEQLRHAQKLEAIGILAGGVAHEFNNLLQVISGYTHFAIESTPANSAAHEDLQQVAGASWRAADLTDQLLCFSRQRILEQQPVDPNRVVGELAENLRPILRDNITLSVETGTFDTQVFADPSELKQALMHLCANAHDAMPDGGRLAIATSLVDLTAEECVDLAGVKPGPSVVISVADTGRGIPAEFKEKIFEPFFTTKEVGGGTGLGLSMAHGIVRQHEGAIHVESKPDRGTVFRVFLPVCSSQSEEAEPAAGMHETELVGDEVLLLTEGEPAVQDFAKRILVEAGYTVHAACDREEATRLFYEHSNGIAVAVLDLVMPHHSGHSLSACLRQRKPNIGLILCTGYDFVISRTGLAAKQEARLLRKPYHPSALLCAVRECLDGGAAGAEWNDFDAPAAEFETSRPALAKVQK